MIVDIDNKEVIVGDDIIFCDNMGVNKGRIIRITDKTIRIQYHQIQQVDGKIGSLVNSFQNIRLAGNNGKYIYKI